MLSKNDLAQLARRVQQGDRKAGAQLRQDLEPSVLRIVRHVLERGQANSSLERKILAAARRLAPYAVPSSSDPRATPLAHNLCQVVVNRLWPGGTQDCGQQTLPA
jgi:hypothetical protein